MTDLDSLQTRRRRARFRAWHRGMREADLILGRFADAALDGMGEAELAEFEHILEAMDRDLMQWLTGEKPTPLRYDTPLFDRIRRGSAG